MPKLTGRPCTSTHTTFVLVPLVALSTALSSSNCRPVPMQNVMQCGQLNPEQSVAIGQSRTVPSRQFYMQSQSE